MNNCSRMSEKKHAMYLRLPQTYPCELIALNADTVVEEFEIFLRDCVYSKTANYEVHIEGSNYGNPENSVTFIYDFSFKAKLDTSKKKLCLYQYGVKFFEMKLFGYPANFYTLSSARLNENSKQHKLLIKDSPLVKNFNRIFVKFGKGIHIDFEPPAKLESYKIKEKLREMNSDQKFWYRKSEDADWKMVCFRNLDNEAPIEMYDPNSGESIIWTSYSEIFASSRWSFK